MDFKNEFSWSKSRAEVLETCERKYWFNHYGFWGGWNSDAPKRTREIYVLKKLHNRYSWTGDVVHKSIEATLKNFQRSYSIDPESVKKEAHALLKKQYLESKRGDYWRAPKKFCGLVEHEYKEEIPDSEWKERADHVQVCLNQFFGIVFPKLLEMGPESIASIEELESFNLDDVKVWVSLDLALKTKNHYLIWDWKTGSIENKELKTDPQLGVYLHFAHKKWETTDLEASLVQLGSNYQTLSISYQDYDWESFHRQFQVSVEQMKSKLSDVSTNTANEERFEKTGIAKNPSPCSHCQYKKVCSTNETV